MSSDNGSTSWVCCYLFSLSEYFYVPVRSFVSTPVPSSPVGSLLEGRSEQCWFEGPRSWKALVECTTAASGWSACKTVCICGVPVYVEERVRLAIGKEKFVIGGRGRLHNAVCLHFLLTDPQGLILLFLLSVPLQVLPFPFTAILLHILPLPLTVILLHQHLHFLVLNPQDYMLLFQQFGLEQARKVVVFLVLFKASINLHEEVALVDHVLLHCFCALEIVSPLVITSYAHVTQFDLFLKVFE